MKRPEILAPAGNVDCFNAAINAGADAIYMAGKQFGARASADNFTEEEFIWALNMAHLRGIKIYLTLNTLIKEEEFKDVYSFVKPLYENKLDGIIVQDLGLIDYLKEEFPNLEIHISTQMTVTGKYAAKLLKAKGVTRIVPARELSLEEIKEIKDNVDIEIESFIHGAMCYAYSGQCLFSSFLGGRSGNRGRCAQPCRLPYTIVEDRKYIKKNEIEYPLSLADMCTITCIDKLIENGIDSFKIEGRLKSPEYVAFATYVYKKYVDMYMETGELKVDKNDLSFLKKIYIRSLLSEGYYFKHNGSDMVTKSNPSYCDNSESLIKNIHDKFVKPIDKLMCTGVVTLVVGEAASIILKYGDIVITYEEGEVQKALSKPLTKDDVIKQLNKTGELPFEFEKLSVEMDDDCFMPVKMLNELRRNAFNELMGVIIYG